MIQSVILVVQARAVGRHQQGAVVGLRHTGQRLTSILIPPLMGGIADRLGANESFVILGTFLLLLCVWIRLGDVVAFAFSQTRCDILCNFT